MTHAGRPFNKRRLSRYRRDLNDPAIPSLQAMPANIPQAVSDVKQIIEILTNARGHRVGGFDVELEETQRLHDQFDPVKLSQRYTLTSDDYYSIRPTDQVVVVDTGAAARNITLPLSTALFVATSLIIACVGANSLTIRVQEGDLVNGVTTLLLNDYQARFMVPIHNGWLAV